MNSEKRELPFGRPIIGEEERKAVLDVLAGPILVHGPRSKEFEASFADFTQSPSAISVSSCTAGLHLAYFDRQIQEGDEVIVPAQTHVATAHSVELCGAKPVFVDAELETGNIDIDQIESAITDRTKAISVVHYLGMPVAMDRVCEIADRHNLFVIEDCALAIGTFYKGKHVGLWGDAGTYSFYPVKHMTTAEGGMVITKHADLAERLVYKRAFGVDRHMGQRKVPGVYDVTMLGFNYRLNEIQSVIGIEQLKKMPAFLEKRKENYEALAARLQQIEGIELFRSTHGDFVSSYYCLSILLPESLQEKRIEFVEKLKSNGVGTSVYYPKPVPHLQYYREKYGYDLSSYPNAARISYGSIALPVGPHLDVDDMNYIADHCQQALDSIR